MKIYPSILALSTIFAAVSLAQIAVGQITFVETPRQTQRTQGQQGQRQPGLSPEKKKSLATYGPEDAFPGAREEGSNQGRSGRSASRQTASKTQPTPTVTPAPSPVLTPSTIAAVTPTPVTTKLASMATDAAATGSSGSGQVNKSQTSKSVASSAVPVALSLATVLVFGALVYVVGILRKRLKSES